MVDNVEGLAITSMEKKQHQFEIKKKLITLTKLLNLINVALLMSTL